MRDKLTSVGITFDDVLLEPRYSTVVPADVDVTTQLTKRIRLNIPLLSSPMDTVTESDMSIALAQEGGLGVIHKNMSVERQTDWYHKINDQFYTFFNGVAYAIGSILAVGALFCTLNTMYAAIGSRRQEIATLRALGYGAFPVAASVIAESVALSVIGALIGAGIAWLLYDGQQDSLWINVFYLTVSPALVGLGILWAVVVALLGGLLPAIRAARRPVAEALRAT